MSPSDQKTADTTPPPIYYMIIIPVGRKLFPPRVICCGKLRLRISFLVRKKAEHIVSLPVSCTI